MSQDDDLAELRERAAELAALAGRIRVETKSFVGAELRLIAKARDGLIGAHDMLCDGESHKARELLHEVVREVDKGLEGLGGT